MDKDYEKWDIIKDGTFVPSRVVRNGDVTLHVPKIKKEFNKTDRKKI